MKKISLLTVLLLIFSLTACSDDGNGTSGDGKLTLDENAFGVKAYVRNMTKETITFMVDPYGGVFQEDGKGEIDGPGGLFGAPGLVAGKKKGDKVDLDGSFKIYAYDKKGPSVEINVKGTYEINDLKNDNSTMHYYIFEGGEFIKSDKETVYK